MSDNELRDQRVTPPPPAKTRTPTNGYWWFTGADAYGKLRDEPCRVTNRQVEWFGTHTWQGVADCHGYFTPLPWSAAD